MKNVRPAIIHGDLWSGNAGTDEQSGQPIIFDPSSSYSHNEAELGIMKMFGGFSSDFFEAYHDVIPKAQPYYQERQEMYEAYHHLNHFVMFGGSYRSGTVRIFKKLIAWAEEEGKSKRESGGDDDSKGGDGSGSRGLRGGSSHAVSSASASALAGCSNTNLYTQGPPPSTGGADVLTSTNKYDTSFQGPNLHYETAFPPATPSQIADYFSQMICYLWFSSGVPGDSMPNTPSRSPTSKHLPLQSSPLAPRRIVAAAPPMTSYSTRPPFRPTHAKTASAGHIFQRNTSASLSSTDLHKAINDQIVSCSSTSNYIAASNKILANDPSLQRLQPKSRFLRFSREVLSTTQVSTSVITLALIYVHRLKAAHPHLKGRDGSEFRLAISSLMLANKILDDNTYLNKTWAEISGMPLAEISKMEVEFWLGLKMELHIDKEDYDAGLAQLQVLADDRNRAVLQRDAAVKRALQQQTLSQSSQWMPYLQPGWSASADGLTSNFDSRFSSPMPPLTNQASIRRSVGNVDAMSNHLFMDATSPKDFVHPPSLYDFGSGMQSYNAQTPPYFSRAMTYTLPPSPLSQASAAGMPFQQQDGFKQSYPSNSFGHDTLASSPSNRERPSYSGDPLWSVLSQSNTTAYQLDTDLLHHDGNHELDISPTTITTNASFAPLDASLMLDRPTLSSQSSSTLSGLKRDFEKTNLDANSPFDYQQSSKRFAAEPNITDDLRPYRVGTSIGRSSQSPTQTRYPLRSRSRASVARPSQRSTSRDAFRWSVSPNRPTSLSVVTSPASQRGSSSHLPRPDSFNDVHNHQPHPNYHSVFSSALTPTALAAPLENHTMEANSLWNGSQSGSKKATGLQYYSLAAGEPYGNISTYLPPPSRGIGYMDSLGGRRTSMVSDLHRGPHRNGVNSSIGSTCSQDFQPPTPISAPLFGDASSRQVGAAKDDLSAISQPYSRNSAPFSLDVHAWPLTKSTSSNFLFPYHLLPPQPSHTTTIEAFQQRSHIS